MKGNVRKELDTGEPRNVGYFSFGYLKWWALQGLLFSSYLYNSVTTEKNLLQFKIDTFFCGLLKQQDVYLISHSIFFSLLL